MPHVFRRVILKPAGLPEADCARLREALAGAVELQCQLGASPHVLQLSGGLQETQTAFFIEHEPGEPLCVADLFNPDAPLADETYILRLAIALADALRAAHERSGPRRAIHGGFCAGTVIETPEGIHKVTDFGIAPAVCSALGAPSYTELAVAPVIDGPEELRGTGVWEVLSPDEETRDDRLCGFIAPEKYASQAFDSFEPGSDVIAAGILLHLVAEHQHPLIGGEGEHRTVDMAAQMGFWLYNGARRKDFRESESPAVKVWCDLVARMLANAPQQRPTAPQIVVAFAEVDVKPVDAAEMLNRAVESAAVAAKEGRWDEVRNTLAGLADSDGVPEDVAAKAQALLRQADCHSLLEVATEQLSGDHWQKAGTTLAELESSPVPPDMAPAVQALGARFRGSTEASEKLSRIDETLAETPESDPESASGVIDRLLEEVEALSTDGDLVPSVQGLRDGVRETLLKKRETLATKLKALSADHEVVHAWFKEANAAWKKERWNDLEALLGDRPATAHWPKAVMLETEELQKRYSDVQVTRAWLKQAAEPLEAEDLDALERLLTERPEVSEWPAQLRAEFDEVDRRITSVKSKAAELARAHEWIESIERSVEARDWSEANRLLVSKPTLEHWPTDLIERETPLREQVEKHLEDVERERLAIEAWLSLVAEAATAKDWSGALELLDTPPIEPDLLPKRTRKDVAARRKEYQKRLQQQRVEELRARNDALRETAEALVREVVRTALRGLLDPKSVHTRIDPLEWNSDVTPTGGTGRLLVAVGAADDAPPENGISRELQIKLEGNVPRILADGEIKSALSERFLDLVKERQGVDVAAPLRAGFFPDAKADMKTSEPAARLPVSISLLGPDVKEAKVDVELVWDPVELSWRFRDPADFTRRAVDIAVGGTRSLIKPAILERSDLLRHYESVLVLDVSAPVVPPDDRFPDSLTFDCRLTIHPRGKAESPPLQQIPVLLPQAGRVVIDADLAPAEGALRKILVDTQEAGRGGLAQSLTARVKQSAMRIKLVSLTKAIKRPVEEVRFELRVRRSEPLVVAAPWDVESFDFGVPEAAESALQELIERQPEAAPPMFGKRAATLGGVAAMGAVVVVGAVYWPESDVVTTPVPNVNANSDSLATNTANTTNANSVSNIDNGESANNTNAGNTGTTLTPSVAVARDELSAILARSSYLIDGMITQYRLVEVAQVAPTAPAVATVKIPGLAGPDLKLTMAPPTPPGNWQLTNADRQQVQDGVAALDKLLGDPYDLPIAGWVKAAGELAGYLGDAQVSVAPAQPTWTMAPAGNAWTASAVELQVSIVTGQGLEPVARFMTELAAESGEVHLAAGQDETLRPQIVDALVAKVVALQQASLQQHGSALQANANVNPDGRALADTSATTGWPTKSLQLSLTPADWMRPRDLTLNWDPSNLAFQLDSPSEVLLRRLPTTLSVLEEIRNTIAKRGSDHWLATVSKGDGGVKELQAPANGTWKLEVTSAWDDAVKLPVEVAIDLSGDSAQAIASVQTAPGPWYEPLIQRIARLSDGTASAPLSPAETQSLKDALAGSAAVELTEFLGNLPADPNDALFTPQYVMQPGAVPVLSNTAWSPQDSRVESMSLPANLTIAANHAAFADSAAGFDPDKLDQTLADAAGGSVAIGVRLKMGQAAAEIDWGGAGALNNALKAPAKLAGGLAEFLQRYPDRITAETSLDAAWARVGDRNEVAPEDDTYQLLKDIWLAKGIDAATLRRGRTVLPVGDLATFSIAMRESLRNPRGRNPGLKPSVSATVFVEYFCGIDSVYAITWSVGLEPAAVAEGPFLAKLCTRDELIQALRQTDQDLGALLLRPVLELVPEALDSSTDQFRGTRGTELGIVIAVDDLLPEGLGDLIIFEEARISRLALIANAEVEDPVPWNSISDLRSSLQDYKGSGVLRQALLSGTRAKELRPTRGSSQDERLAAWDAALASRADQIP